MKKFLSIAALFFFLGLAWAQEDPAKVFRAANQAYDQKNYTTAVDQYRTLLEKENVSAAIYYNLGNAYFRLGNLGEAIWCYRKALKLNPTDPETKENLEFARLYQVDKIGEQKSFFLLSLLTSLPKVLGLGLLSWSVTLVWWLALASLLLFFVYRKRSKIIKALMLATLLLLVWFGLSLWSGAKAEQKKVAVVLASQTEAKSGPGEDYISLFTVHSGLECQIEEERGGWYLIYLSNGSRGWVLAKALGLI